MEGNGEGNPPPESQTAPIRRKTRAEIRAEVGERNALLRDTAQEQKEESRLARKAEIEAKKHQAGGGCWKVD